MNIDEVIGSNLKKLRKFHRLKVIDVAKATGWSDACVSYLENGKRRFKAHQIHKLSKLFAVSIDDLFKEDWMPGVQTYENYWANV